MPLYLPDTNVVSRNFQQRDDQLAEKMAAVFPYLRLATIVLAELEHGASKSGIARHRQRLDALLRLGAIVVTHNIREFSRVPGLRCEDWQTG